MKVNCDVEEIEMHGDYAPVPGVCVTCSRCGDQTEAYGTSPRSVRRALVMLREECPMGEDNYYTADEAEDEG